MLIVPRLPCQLIEVSGCNALSEAYGVEAKAFFSLELCLLGTLLEETKFENLYYTIGDSRVCDWTFRNRRCQRVPRMRGVLEAPKGKVEAKSRLVRNEQFDKGLHSESLKCEKINCRGVGMGGCYRRPGAGEPHERTAQYFFAVDSKQPLEQKVQ